MATETDELVMVIDVCGAFGDRREVRGPFTDEAQAWKWWFQQCHYPAGTRARVEKRIIAPVVPRGETAMRAERGE